MLLPCHAETKELADFPILCSEEQRPSGPYPEFPPQLEGFYILSMAWVSLLAGRMFFPSLSSPSLFLAAANEDQGKKIIPSASNQVQVSLESHPPAPVPLIVKPYDLNSTDLLFLYKWGAYNRENLGLLSFAIKPWLWRSLSHCGLINLSLRLHIQHWPSSLRWKPPSSSQETLDLKSRVRVGDKGKDFQRNDQCLF